jgi:hypothetical protein
MLFQFLIEFLFVGKRTDIRIRVQRFLKLKKSPASIGRKSSVLILKNICNLLCVVLAPEL